MALVTNGSFKALSAFATATAAEWAATTGVIPEGLPIFESDTGFLKVGDGVSIYSELDYVVSEVLTSAQKAYLTNAGAAGGVLILDSNAQVPLSAIPPTLRQGVVYAADIAARDAIPEVDRVSLVIVADASADATVEAGWATYGWNPTASSWVKISEGEGLDIDFSDHFLMSTNTLDQILDGTTFVKISATEKATWTALAANALVKDGVYEILAPTPADLMA